MAHSEVAAASRTATHIEKTDQYGAHNYHPLPVVIDRAEGVWVWLNGEPMVYTNWRAGEPNDGGTNGEDCMIIEGDHAGLWDDRSCVVSYPYLCERVASQ